MKNKRNKYPVKILVSLEEETNDKLIKRSKLDKVYKNEFIRDAIKEKLN